MALPVLALTSLFISDSHAQPAKENAVAEAGGAFGTAVGREEIGLYSARSARTFSPSQAGNLRIDGLYFDQVAQYKPNSRIVRGSSVHVGISALPTALAAHMPPFWMRSIDIEARANRPSALSM